MNSEDDVIPKSDSASEPDSNPSTGSADTEPTLPQKTTSWFRQSFNPFRIATLRGLAVLLPPLLTIIFFVWAWNAIDRAVLRPIESLSRHSLVWATGDIRPDMEVQTVDRNADPPGSRIKSIEGENVFMSDEGKAFVKVGSNWIPLEVAFTVRDNPGDIPLETANAFYLRYVQLRYLKRHLVIPAFLSLFLVVMYLVGKLLAAGIGRIFYRFAEALIHRLPIIRNVYSSVKQVTDFVFDDSEVQFNRVVAVEYPRKGVWSVGFVTGDSLLDIRDAAGEPMLSVLMPTSPMPATGFTISVPKSETVDLNITMDQAIQFCVSCGVVVPPHQMSKSTLEGDLRRRSQSDPAMLEHQNDSASASIETRTKDDSQESNSI